MSEEIQPEAEPEATPEAPAEAAPPAESVTVTEDATAEQVAEAQALAQIAVVAQAIDVTQKTPSNEAPAEEPAVEAAPQNTLEDAAAKLLAIVDEGHKLGDRTLDAARDELRAILGA